ncbi:MAG: hypothetical protein GXP31_07535 [Kiritimatiellaeota bacterium]|nr:hypothetical protein [Kiritimatiellota bacterium]
MIREELNYIFQGCYTTQCRIKRANRLGPVLLYEAELWAALAARMGLDPEYPGANFNRAWEAVCFNQFHDILPGSGVPATVEYSQGLFQEVQAVAHSATGRALRVLDHALRELPPDAGRLAEPQSKTGEAFSRSEGAGVGLQSDSGRVSLVCRGRGPVRHFTAFNPSPWERGGLVSVRLWDLDLPPGTELTAGHPGRCLRPVQAVGEGHYWGHHYREVLFPACRVPGCGYATCRVGPRPVGAELEAPEDPVRVSGTTGYEDHNFRRTGGGIGIENRRVRLALDPIRARISSLVDKRSGRELISAADLSSLLVLYREAPHGMTAWRIGTFVARDEIAWENAVVTERGPYRAAIRCPFSFGRSHGSLTFSLENNSNEVRIHLELHWLEHGSPQTGVPFLKLRLPMTLEKAQAVYTTPFGSVRHPARDQETPSIGRVTLAESFGERQGLTVLSDSKYGFRFVDSVLETSIIRGSYDPDPYPDLGVHHVDIGLRPHAAGLAEGAVQRAAFDFVHPLSAVENYSGEGEVRGGYMAVGPQNILVAAVKKPEDGDGLVLRLYETEGRDTEALVMLDPRLGPETLEAWSADVHEQPLEKLPAPSKTGVLRVPVRASSLCTVLLRDRQ